MSVIDIYTVLKVAPHCSIEIIFLFLQPLFSRSTIFMSSFHSTVSAWPATRRRYCHVFKNVFFEVQKASGGK